MLGFRLDGKMPLPHPEFDCERVRYEHRFAPFSCMLTPPPVQYAEFYDMTLTLQHSHSQGLYMHGCKHFHQARSLLESITNPDNEVSQIGRGILPKRNNARFLAYHCSLSELNCVYYR